VAAAAGEVDAGVGVALNGLPVFVAVGVGVAASGAESAAAGGKIRFRKTGGEPEERRGKNITRKLTKAARRREAGVFGVDCIFWNRWYFI
jgi:hypothetical protein